MFLADIRGSPIEDDRFPLVSRMRAGRICLSVSTHDVCVRPPARELSLVRARGCARTHAHTHTHTHTHRKFVRALEEANVPALLILTKDDRINDRASQLQVLRLILPNPCIVPA